MDILEDSGGAVGVGVCTDGTSGKGGDERAAVAAALEGAATNVEGARRRGERDASCCARGATTVEVESAGIGLLGMVEG